MIVNAYLSTAVICRRLFVPCKLLVTRVYPLRQKKNALATAAAAIHLPPFRY